MRKGKLRRRRSARRAIGLGSVLDGVADAPLSQVMDDAERFICSVCTRPVKRCLSDPHWICNTKWREGTVLHAVRQAVRTKPHCLSCGRLLTVVVLRRNPLAEVCPSCRRKPVTTPHQPEKEERHGPKARGA